MRVFVAKKGYDHEGFEPIGVSKTNKGAVKICDDDDGFLDPIYDVEEFELTE